MPKHSQNTNYKPKPNTAVQKLIARNNKKATANLSTDAQTFFEFLVLLVDIRFHHRYNKPLEVQRGRSYSPHAQPNNIQSGNSFCDDAPIG